MPKSGDEVVNGREINYIYHDQLQFLAKTIKPRETISSISEQYCEKIEELPTSISEINLPVQVQNNEELKKNQKNKSKTVEDSFIEYIEEVTKQNKIYSNFLKKDEHERFFDSILHVVRQFNVDQTLEFRREIINIIQKIKYGSNYSTFKFQQPQYKPSTNYYHCHHDAPQSKPLPTTSQISNIGSIATSSLVQPSQYQSNVDKHTLNNTTQFL